MKLTDLTIAQICEVTNSTINRWRKKLFIPTKIGTGRWIHEGRVKLYMPKEYQHPEIIPNKKGVIRYEHVVVMERYLSEHPELEISKKCLVKGKYLKKGCVVHHINFVPLDNRLENLWVCESGYEHQLIESSLLAFVDELLQSKLLVFRKGVYSLDY